MDAGLAAKVDLSLRIFEQQCKQTTFVMHPDVRTLLDLPTIKFGFG